MKKIHELVNDLWEFYGDPNRKPDYNLRLMQCFPVKYIVKINNRLIYRHFFVLLSNIQILCKIKIV